MDVTVLANESSYVTDDFTDDVTDEVMDSHAESLKTKLALVWIFVGLSVLGIIGNCYSILLLSGKKQRRRKILSDSYRIYIIALAVADNGMLFFTGILRYAVIAWMYETHRPSWLYEVYLCRWHRFFMHASHNAAVWLLVVMAMDRFVAVCFPFHYREVKQNSRKAVQVTVIVFILSFIFATPFLAVGPLYDNDDEQRRFLKNSEHQPNFFNSSSSSLEVGEAFEKQWITLPSSTQLPSTAFANSWSNGTDPNAVVWDNSSLTSASDPHHSVSARIVSGCSLTATIAEKYAFVVNIIFHVLLAFLIPYFVLIILNVAIFRSLHYPSNATSLSGSRQRLHRRITIMMLVVCCTFIVLWLPQAFLLMSSSDAHSHKCNDEEILHSLAALCGLSNSALNFVLYCMTVKRFRNEASRSIKTIFCFVSVRKSSDTPSNNNLGRSYSKKQSSIVTYNAEGSPLTDFVSKSNSNKKTKFGYKESKRLHMIPEHDVESSRYDDEIC